MLTSGLFDGLYPAECILMLLGILLFFVLIFALLYSLFKDRPTIPIYAAFLLPVAMIGYSRLQTVSFENGVGKLQFATEQLQADPTNHAKREEVDRALGDVAARADSTRSAETAAAIANGQFAAGQTTQAKVTLQKAVTLNPSAPAVQQLQEKIITLDQLHAATQKLQAAPANTADRAKLNDLLVRSSAFKLANPEAIAQVASAQAAAGQSTKAEATARTALTIAPSQPLALQVIRSPLVATPRQ